MKYNNIEVKLPKFESFNDEEYFNFPDNIDKKCVPTDFVSLLGELSEKNGYCRYYLNSDSKLCNELNFMHNVSSNGQVITINRSIFSALRPMFLLKNDIIQEKNEIIKIGEYPQNIVDINNQYLEKLYANNKLLKTGKIYTTSAHNNIDSNKLIIRNFIEYMTPNGCKLIRFISDGFLVKKGQICWIEVRPIECYIDYKQKLLLSKYALISGIKYNLLNDYIKNYFTKEIIPSIKSNEELTNFKQYQKTLKLSN